MKAYVFFTRGAGIISDRIASITCMPGRSPAYTPSHCGMLWNDGKGFEAHMATGGWARTDLIDLGTWLQKHSERKAWHMPIASGVAAQRMRNFAEGQMGLWQYHKMQLAQLWVWKRLRFPIVPRSQEVVCSEAVGRVCFDDYDWPAICGLKPQQFDKLTPAGMHDAALLEVRDGLPPVDPAA